MKILFKILKYVAFGFGLLHFMLGYAVNDYSKFSVPEKQLLYMQDFLISIFFILLAMFFQRESEKNQ